MINKLLNKFKSRYLVVYQNQDGEVKSYEITRPKLNSSIANKQEGRNNFGFRDFCFARNLVSRFRHDRVISITKL